MAASFINTYKSQHRHPLNRLCHSFGIPMITISWPLFFFKWRWALALFVIGWMLQFVGHAIEGNRPAFFQSSVASGALAQLSGRVQRPVRSIDFSL